MKDAYRVEYSSRFGSYMIIRNNFPLWFVGCEEQAKVAIENDKRSRTISSKSNYEFLWTVCFLNNFTESKIEYKDLTYNSIEAAFQAQKCPERATEFCNLTPAEAKQLGKKVVLRKDWEENKDRIMLLLLDVKFHLEPFKTQLMNTGNTFLIANNNYNDTYWGICNNVGKNRLGDLLMIIREQLWYGD